MIIVYQAIYEDLTHLVEPIGVKTRIPEIVIGTYDSCTKAKKKCESDYKKYGTMEWFTEDDGFHSEDLGHGMYHVRPLKVE